MAISTRWQEETHKREQEIYEQVARGPARAAVREAINRVTMQERSWRVHKRMKSGLIGLGGLFLIAFIILLLFLPVPQWLSALVIIIVASMFLTSWIWKSPIAEQTILHNKKEIEHCQTQRGDYASLSEEERGTLLLQRII